MMLIAAKADHRVMMIVVKERSTVRS